MPEVAKCPLCGKKPFPYHYEEDHIEYVHCGVKCEDEGTWNRYAAAMESQAKLDELRERVAWMLECEYAYRMRDFLKCGWAQIEIDYTFHTARQAVEELL